MRDEMNFVERITGTITDPRNTMKSIAEVPMIEEGVVIVGIYAVLSAISAYIQSSKFIYIMEGFENMAAFQESMAIFSIVTAILGPFIFWLIGTGIIHLISMALGGEGKFYPQMMTVSGYSTIPLLFSGVLGIALFSVMEPMNITISATNPMANEIYSNPYIIASTAAGIMTQIWAAIIFVFGVQSSHKLTVKKSAIAVGIPLAFNLMLALIPALLSMWRFSS